MRELARRSNDSHGVISYFTQSPVVLELLKTATDK